MDELKIAVCDDSIVTHNVIKEFKLTAESELNCTLTISFFSKGNDLIESYKMGQTYNLIIMDIEMPGENGIDIIKLIKLNYDRLVTTVFLTDYPKYMQNSFSVHAYDFITKPLTYSTFTQTLSSILKDYAADNQRIVLYGENSNAYNVYIKDIVMIESGSKLAFKNKLIFHTPREKYYLRTTFEELDIIKKHHEFFIINRSICINFNWVKQISGDTLTMDNGLEIFISSHKRLLFMKAYNNYVSNKYES